MRTVCIIQARMGSSRLPGKVLMDLAGQPVLWHVVSRARKIRNVDLVGVATSTDAIDDAVAQWCQDNAIPVARGPEADVLQRYLEAAQHWDADAVVRVTADCPVLDPAVATKVVERFLEGDVDYASNTVDRTYPDGLDAEAFSMEALTRAANESSDLRHREHVTTYIYDHPDSFRLASVKQKPDRSHLRWTLDFPDDLTFLRSVFEGLQTTAFGQKEVLRLLEREPSLQELNKHHVSP